MWNWCNNDGKLQGQDWKKIAQTLKNVGAPTTAKKIGSKTKSFSKSINYCSGIKTRKIYNSKTSKND